MPAYGVSPTSTHPHPTSSSQEHHHAHHHPSRPRDLDPDRALRRPGPHPLLDRHRHRGRPAEPQVTRERGVVLECTGTHRGRDVRVDLYENDPYGNSLQIVIGDPDRGGVFNGKDTEASLWAGRTVQASLKVGSKRATVSGLAKKVGPRRAVHDELDDAGQHIVADGFHRRLRTDLTLRYGGRTAPLTCDTAFSYDLTVTKEDLA